MIQTILPAALTAYICACVIGASSLFAPVRGWVMRHLPKLQIAGHKHFIECRLCLSFWSSCGAVLLFGLPLVDALPVYGLAYFLATQER